MKHYIFSILLIIASKERQESSEGVELDMAVSYLSRFSVYKAIKDKLDRDVRCFCDGYPGVKSTATLDDFNSEKNYKAFSAHGNTVVGNESLVKEFASIPKVKAYGLNPGLIATDIRSNFLGKDSWASWVPFVNTIMSLLRQIGANSAADFILLISFWTKVAQE
jgi:hypothetical protein